jgi:aminopeptidase N
VIPREAVLRFSGAVLAIVLLVLTSAAADKAPTRFVEDRSVDCTHIALDLAVDLTGKRIRGTAHVDLRTLIPVEAFTLDAVDLEVAAVRVTQRGEPRRSELTYDGMHLVVTLAEPVPAGEDLRASIDYSVGEEEDGLHWFGPTRDEPDVPVVVWSQGEAVFSSHWFPCIDVPSEKHTSEMTITARRGLEVSSNGRLVSREEVGDDVRWHWALDVPHATYLMSLIAGEFHVTRGTWHGKSIEYWVHPAYAEWSDRSFRNTERMLDFISEYTGVEYPWERYAQICCEGFGGGMENTTATTLGTRALHDERSLLDGNSDGLIVHELAHQWFGDYTTCRDWSHIWLNEGFASYFESLWEEVDHGADGLAYDMVEKAREAKRGGTELPIVDRAYADPDGVFDARAYPKGAWVLHMLRHRLGDPAFRQVLERFLEDNALRAVETVDLRKAVEAVTGRSFERFFFDWTERPGHPKVKVVYEWQAAEKTVQLDVEQSQDAAAFHFPLVLELAHEGGSQRFTREITEKAHTFHFPLPSAPTAVRVDPDQTVLMDLVEEKPRELWVAQLLRDPSVAARVRAVEHFAESRRPADLEGLALALAEDSFWAVRSEAAAALAKIGGDEARDALIGGLAQEDPRVRRACADALGGYYLDAKAIAAVRPLVVDGDASYRVESAAIRTYARLGPGDAVDVIARVLERDSRFETLRNAALDALGLVADPRAIDLLVAWTGHDKPRLCRPSAIGALAEITKRADIDDPAVIRIVEALQTCLADTGTWTRSSAARALGSIREPSLARRAVPALEALAANDPKEWVRKAAKQSVESIRSGQPPQVQLAELRAELEEALEQNKGLAERLAKLERERSAAGAIQGATAGAAEKPGSE